MTNQQAGAIPSRRVSLSPLFIFGSFFAIWVVVGYLATIPVAGDHPYWRTLRAHPGDFDLVAEDVSFSATEKILAVVGELSWFNLIFPKALFLIPLTRFPGFVWLIAVGFKLPKSTTRTTSVGA